MDNDFMPPGVTLQDWDDYDTQRKSIFDNVHTAVKKKFPAAYKGVRVELLDSYYADPESYTLKEQKDALMQDKFLGRRLRGKVRLADEASGNILDEREMTLMTVPWLTGRGTTIHNGSEYVTLRQARLKPGVYVRRKANDDLEAHFNAKRATGPSFRTRFEPQTAMYKLDIGQSSLHLYSLLKDLGVSDDELEKRWGKDILDVSRQKYDARVFDKAYNRLVKRPDPNADRLTKIQAIKDALDSTKLDAEVLQRTLPNLFSAKVASAWRVHNKESFKKTDYTLLAQVLNDKFQAGIPIDVPTEQLVAEILKELQEQHAGIEPEILTPFVESVKSAAVGKYGCLMAVLEPVDAMQVQSWIVDNIPTENVGESGLEHESHVTVLYGFKSGFDVAELKKFLKEQKPIRMTMGKTKVFDGVNNGKEDCLVVSVDSEDLKDLNKRLQERFGPNINQSKFSYNPHMTLAYMNCGEAEEFSGHCRFKGETYIVKRLVFSSPFASEKEDIELDSE